MKTVRIWFKKVGTARYISHLDLTRCMSRVLKISRLPVWYTEGFNPRIYMTFGMPLSLGVSGERECMDIRLTEDVAGEEICRRLNERLPEGLLALEAQEAIKKIDAIRWSVYEIVFSKAEDASIKEKLEKLLAQESVFVAKHTKKGEKMVDIKPEFSQMEYVETEDQLCATVCLPSSVNGSVNPGLLVDALAAAYEKEYSPAIIRKKMLDESFQEIQ